ncbi:MAG: HEAT repeat domain-containing protein [Methylococcales bacterium]|jgi:hypothetical protein|nr:HEAT repeat domain-containing protein [Methylococcales bacterium]
MLKTKNKFELWLQKIDTDNSVDRAEELENYPDDYDNEVSDIFMDALNDSASIVRQVAAEMLGVFSSLKIKDALRERLEIEKNSLVKEYLFSSLGMIAEIEDLKYLIKSIGSAKNEEELIHLYMGVFYAGRNIAKNKLLKFITDKNIIVSTSAVNALVQLTIKSNETEIVNAIKIQIEKRKGKGDVHDFEDALNEISSIDDDV